MNPQEKLVLIRESCEHANEYKPRNKTAFWDMIRALLKEQTVYDLQEPRVTVTRWVKARIDELVEEEMGSGTQVEQDDFKAAVEQFASRMNSVQKNLDSAVKDKQAQAAELFEAAKLQSGMVYGLDDEPIAGVELGAGLGPSNRTISSSIALNASRKRKRDDIGISNDAVLLSEIFEKSTAVLAQALVNSGRELTTTNAQAASDNLAFDKKISDMEHRIEAKMEARWGDIESKLDRILSVMGEHGASKNSS